MARNFAATWAQNRGGQQPDGRQRKDRSRYQHKGRGGFGDNRIAQEIQQREQSPQQSQQTWAADRGSQQRQDPAFQAQQGYLRQERPQQQPDGATAYTQSQSGQAMKPVNQTPMGSARQTVQGFQMGRPGPTTQEVPQGYRDLMPMARPGPTTQEMPQGYREMINRSGPTFDLPKGYQEMINRPTASQADRLREAFSTWEQRDQGREESPAALMAREYGQERKGSKRLPQGYEDFTRRETTQGLPQGYQEWIDQTRQQPDESTLAERMVEGYGDQPDRPPDISRLIGSGYEEGTGIVPEMGTAPTDFQAPRSVDEALQQRLLQSLSTQAGVDDPVAAAQRADYEERTRQARQQQIEELNRLGILRGGGDTAAILGQFDVGALRGQQQISADMAMRQQEALNQALQFEQQRQTGELGRGQLSQQAQQMALDRELGRRELAAREGQMTGRFGGADTLAREEMDLRRELMEQQRAMGLAELTGQVGEGLRGYGAPVGAQTLAAQELAQRQAESEAERGLRREELTGEITGVGGLKRSLAAQEMEQRGSQFEQELAQQEALAEAQRDLAREEMRGYTYDPRTGQMVRTVEGQRLGQEASQFEADRLLREAGITGMYDGAETLAAQQARQQQELAVAGLTGMYRGQTTLGGQQQRLAEQNLEQDRLFREAALTGRYGDQDTLDARQLAQREALAQEGLALDRAELYGEGAEGQRTLEAEQAERESQLDYLAQEIALAQLSDDDLGGRKGAIQAAIRHGTGQTQREREDAERVERERQAEIDRLNAIEAMRQNQAEEEARAEAQQRNQGPYGAGGRMGGTDTTDTGDTGDTGGDRRTGIAEKYNLTNPRSDYFTSRTPEENFPKGMSYQDFSDFHGLKPGQNNVSLNKTGTGFNIIDENGSVFRFDKNDNLVSTRLVTQADQQGDDDDGR